MLTGCSSPDTRKCTVLQVDGPAIRRGPRRGVCATARPRDEQVVESPVVLECEFTDPGLVCPDRGNLASGQDAGIGGEQELVILGRMKRPVYGGQRINRQGGSQFLPYLSEQAGRHSPGSTEPPGPPSRNCSQRNQCAGWRTRTGSP